MKSRRIILRQHEDFQLDTQEQANAFHRAIGYAAMWGISNISDHHMGEVNIVATEKGEIHAGYSNTDGHMTFYMEGFYDPDTGYRFHS